MSANVHPRSAPANPVRRRLLAGAAMLPLLALPMMASHVMAQEEAVVIPAPASDLKETGHKAELVLAGGCFWGVQGVFQRVKGVESAVSGYAGGSASTATYEQSSTGTTGHAESVEITYDPAQVSFGELLQVYFSVAHNPTQLNYQGPDHGTQYRSTIFVQNPEQEKVAKSYIEQLDQAGVFNVPIVTTLEPLKGFYPAEQYHQDFLTLNPDWPYIVINDMPKVAALESLFPDLYRADPVLVGQL